MDRRTRFREAVKTSLALALAYGISLQADWGNPSWAALAVAMISLPTAGQSIQKGMLRLAGTIPGCIAAFVIIGLAPQNRWLFMLLAGTWIFFTTYMLLVDKKRSYFWNVAGFVCLIIALTGPESPANLFGHAMLRTVQTAMGITVYTLVVVFLWPRSNAGAITKAAGAFVAAQAARCRAGGVVMAGREVENKLAELQTQEIQKLDQLGQALQAPGSERYEVHELRQVWERFQRLSNGLMQAMNRWQAGLDDLAGIPVNVVMPGLQAFFTELDGRFAAMGQALASGGPPDQPHPVSLALDPTAFRQLPLLQRSALRVTSAELEKMDVLTRSLVACAGELAGGPAPSPSPPPERAVGSGWQWLVPDLDHLRGATFAASTLGVGFLIWILFDPPGHAGWFEFPTIIAMAVARVQQLKATLFIRPIAVASAFGLAAYVFIMPQLSSFAGLGALLFVAMFAVCYFFSGIARLAGIIGIITQISVQNPQSYNFAAMANGYIYILLAFSLVFGMSYMIRSPRPEKHVLHLMRRFFRSTGFLVAQMEARHGVNPSLLGRWRAAFHLREMRTVPTKLGAWGKAIDRKKFPGNTPDQLQAVVTSLQALGHRVEQLREAGGAAQAESIARDLRADGEIWCSWMQQAFARWSSLPEAKAEGDLRQGMKDWLTGLERKVEETVRKVKDSVTEKEGESFYRLLGSYRGVSRAARAYAGVAGSLDWAHWREERF